jgi:ATP-binding cassette subfamily F protein uup
VGAAGADAAASYRPPSAQETREAKKAMARIEKQLARVTERADKLHAELAEHAADYERLAALGAELETVEAEKDALEEEWLAAASLLE